MSKIFDLFKEIDYLGREFRFEHETNNRHKTVYGAFFSLIIFSAALVFAILFGQEVYQRKHPNISMSNQKIEDSTFFLKDFPMTFTFNHLGTSEYNPYETFDIEIEYIHFPSADSPEGGHKIYTNNSLVPCEEVLDIFNRENPAIEDFIQNNIIKSSFQEYCYNFTEDMYIRRELTSPSSAYFVTRLAYCDPEKRSDCTYNREYFFERGTLIGFGFMDNYVDAVNFSNPVQSSFQRLILSLSEGIRKTEFFHVVQETFISDDGWMTEDLREIPYYTYGHDRDVVLMDKSNKVLGFVIDAPRLTKKTIRNYLKVQELFARVGGIANAFMILIQVLTYHFIKYKYYFFVFGNSLAVVEEGPRNMQNSLDFNKIVQNNMESSAQVIIKSNAGAMSQLVKENMKVGTEKKEEQEEARDMSKSDLNLIKKESNTAKRLLSALPAQKENDVRRASNPNSNINNYINLRKGSEEAQKEKTKEIKEEDRLRKKPEKEGDYNLAMSKSLKSVELKKERKEIIAGSSECHLNSSEIRYSHYFMSTLFPCCISTELKRKYDHEIKRIAQVLDVKSLYHFLVESYSIE